MADNEQNELRKDLARVKEAKAKLEEAERRVEQLKGKRAALLDRLKNEFGFSNPAEAENRVEEMEVEIMDLEGQLKDELERIDDLLKEMEEQSDEA